MGNILRCCLGNRLYMIFALIIFYIYTETPGTNSTHDDFTPPNTYWLISVGIILGQLLLVTRFVNFVHSDHLC